MTRGEPNKWRAHFNQLISRPIPTTAFPALIGKMRDDCLICILTEEGYAWYCGRYEIAPKVIREMWGLSVHQYRRLINWIIVNDPFMEE